MTETFEVGQKVKHSTYGDVEVTYGPFRGRFTPTAYLVRRADGREGVAAVGSLSVIPETPKFALGDKVRAGFTSEYTATIIAGPFTSRHGDGAFFIVEDEDGKHGFPTEATLTKVVEPEPVKVGDRVRVVKDDLMSRPGEFIGKVGNVLEVGNRIRPELTVRVKLDSGHIWWVAEVERVEDENTYIHDGVTYDLTARYRDVDGDEWRFARFGDAVRAAAYGYAPDENSQLADGVLARWAPFTRI